MKKRSKLFLVAILAIIVFCMPAFAGITVVFTDVPDNHWAKNEIYYFESLGVVKGVGDNKFDPSGGVTREQFATMLVKAFDAPLVAASENTFSDVPKDRWSYVYIETCKEFLTGYRNIFGGKPSFRPTEYATREDITVALVKMMGYTDEEVENSNYAYYKFNDSDDISTELFSYVSFAAEKKLISGYPDGTFAPNKGITRAEAVVLINKATKVAYSDINKELPLEVEVVEGEADGEVFLSISTEQGTTVTVDGKSVKMSDNGYDAYEGSYKYTFTMEGSKTFSILAKKQGREAKQDLEYVYKRDVPILTISTFPTLVKDKNVTLSGTILDKRYTAELLINGESVKSTYFANVQERWSANFVLKEGINTFVFVLKNSKGVETTVTKTIELATEGPRLNITSFPTSVTDKNVTISGTIYDKNYLTSLTINGVNIDETYYNGMEERWSANYTLKEGINSFDFVLKSTNGKEYRETRTINFISGGPQITITTFPEAVTSKKVNIGGVFSDPNYVAELLINDVSVDSSLYAGYEERFSADYILTEGENRFKFQVKNAIGQVKELERTMIYTPSPSVLELIVCPEISKTSTVRLSGTIFDSNYIATLYINNGVVDYTYYEGYKESWSYDLSLVEGENTVTFELKNTLGKVVTLTKTIVYQP